MAAEWNAESIAQMGPQENLHNTCLQLEQKYVEWRYPATHSGCCIVRTWPAIGELGRLTTQGTILEFVTTRKRSIVVRDGAGIVKGEVPMEVCMAQALYGIAFAIAENYLKQELL
jgi:hypothetical protein